MKNVGDNFDKNIKYRLYRNIHEIIHPTISKKNISSYEIVVSEDLLPIHVFYPDKVSNLNRVFIYIPGNGDVDGCKYCYSDICREIATNLESLVIAVDYFAVKGKFTTIINKCLGMVNYLVEEFRLNGITDNNITLMGDSTGANIICGMVIKSSENEKLLLKSVLISPVVSGEYFGKTKYESIIKNGQMDLHTINNLESYMRKYVTKKTDMKNPLVSPLELKDYSMFSKTLVITGDLDPLRDEGSEFYKRLEACNVECSYKNIDFCGHGFIKKMDDEVQYAFYTSIASFLDI